MNTHTLAAHSIYIPIRVLGPDSFLGLKRERFNYEGNKYSRSSYIIQILLGHLLCFYLVSSVIIKGSPYSRHT